MGYRRYPLRKIALIRYLFDNEKHGVYLVYFSKFRRSVSCEKSAHKEKGNGFIIDIIIQTSKKVFN
jgi:hypothetical protein